MAFIDKHQGIVAVCDPDAKRRAAGAERYGCPAYRKAADLIADPQVELVDVASRSPQHVRHTVTALKAGKGGGYLPDEDPAKTHLGAEQWAWLEEELKKPAELRLLCSSTQVIPNQKGMDEWGNFPRERQRLLDLLGNTNGVVLLSGNVHFAEISRLKEGAAYPLTELTSSGMTHINEVYAKAPNAHRVGAPCVGLNFGMVEVDWTAGTVTLNARRVDGSSACAVELSLESLRAPE